MPAVVAALSVGTSTEEPELERRPWARGCSGPLKPICAPKDLAFFKSKSWREAAPFLTGAKEHLSSKLHREKRLIHLQLSTKPETESARAISAGRVKIRSSGTQSLKIGSL